MGVKVKRNTRGTVAAILNFLMIGAAGVVILGNEVVGATASTLWLLVGLMLILWSVLVFTGLLRPIMAETDETGITIRKLVGQHRFLWEELLWVDFERSERYGIISAKVDGRERFAAIVKRGVEPEAYIALVDDIRSRRPDIPTRRPEGKSA